MKTCPLALTVFFLISISLLAISPWQSVYAADQNLIERLNQLEAETQALHSEVSRMRQDVVRLPNVEPSAASNSVILVSNTYEPADPAPPVPWAVPLSTASQSAEQIDRSIACQAITARDPNGCIPTRRRRAGSTFTARTPTLRTPIGRAARGLLHA